MCTWFRFTIVCLAATSLSAAQDDIRVMLRNPTYLFDGNEAGKVNALSDSAFHTGFGAYLYGDEFHAWQFHAGVDLTVMSFGENSLWRASLTMEGLADGQNKDSWFRLVQTQYDFFTAFELRFGDSVGYAGYHHKCRHGSDKIPSRIVMRSGPEIGYNAYYSSGAWALTVNSALNVFIVAQNHDLFHQPRIAGSSVAQLEWTPVRDKGLFLSAGTALSWITNGVASSYWLWSPALWHDLLFSPGLGAGAVLRGKLGEFRPYLTYHSNLDAGFREHAIRTNLIAINGEFWF